MENHRAATPRCRGCPPRQQCSCANHNPDCPLCAAAALQREEDPPLGEHGFCSDPCCLSWVTKDHQWLTKEMMVMSEVIDDIQEDLSQSKQSTTNVHGVLIKDIVDIKTRVNEVHALNQHIGTLVLHHEASVTKLYRAVYAICAILILIASVQFNAGRD